MRAVALCRLVAVITLAAAPAASLRAEPSAAPTPLTPHELPPGDGVYCGFAIFGLLAEIGDRCEINPDPAFQAELRRSVTRMEAYIRQNGQVSDADIAKFKHEQSQVGAPTAQLCTAEWVGYYRNFAAQNAAALIAHGTDIAVARPGKPTWGTCL